MIGQKEVLKKVDNLIKNGFPRFLIITGPKGQGKTELAIEISKRLKIPFCNFSIKIDDIREMIQMSYKQTEPIIYLISNADRMSIGAKNSLLKVIEEPPNNAYFIMTLQQIENTLPTIKSRCVELKMDNYSYEEKRQMMEKIKPDITDLEDAIIDDIATNYYEIQLLINYGITQFYDYVQKVFNHIYKVQSANSFKLSEKLALKNEEDKYDVELFLRTFRTMCSDELLNHTNIEESEDFICYAKSIDVTSDAIQQLYINGINKSNLIDIWILDIRKIWR